jgi:hypothetical protein
MISLRITVGRDEKCIPLGRREDNIKMDHDNMGGGWVRFVLLRI